jgi:hypothetical protein
VTAIWPTVVRLASSTGSVGLIWSSSRDTYAHVLKNDDRAAAEQAAVFLIGSEDKPSQDNEHG